MTASRGVKVQARISAKATAYDEILPVRDHEGKPAWATAPHGNYRTVNIDGAVSPVDVPLATLV
jgi:hypothetical protein